MKEPWEEELAKHDGDWRNPVRIPPDNVEAYLAGWNAAIKACFDEIAKRCAVPQEAFEAVERLKK